jgi:RimJ/RimL family protein N-acetyltransferase
MPAFPDLDQPLTDGVVSLRLSAEWDIPDILIAHQDDPQLHVRLGMERPPSGAELGRAAEREPVEREAGTHLELTVVEPGGVDCRGRINVHNIRWEHRRAELGIWLAPALRGRGLAQRALILAAGWLFEQCGLERLAILTEPDNEPMLRAAEAAGFQREGVLRSYGIEQGRRIDLVSLSLLPRDLASRSPTAAGA